MNARVVTAAILLTATMGVCQEYVRVVPAVASGPGRLGTYWTTHLWLTGFEVDEATRVLLSFYPPNEANWEPVEREVLVAPGTTLDVEDVVASLFGASGPGALVLRSELPFEARSLTASPSPSGPGVVGQGIPAMQRAEYPLYEGVLLGAANRPGPQGTRTNFGVFNLGYCDQFVVIEVHADDGDLLGRSGFLLGPAGWKQVDVFGITGLAEEEVPSATVTYSTPLRVAAYLSRIDNATADAAFIPPAADPRPAAPQEFQLWVLLQRSGLADVASLTLADGSGKPHALPSPSEAGWLAGDQTWALERPIQLRPEEQTCVALEGVLSGDWIEMLVRVESPSYVHLQGGVHDQTGPFRINVCVSYDVPECEREPEG